jgi:hypothetical protein
MLFAIFTLSVITLECILRYDAKHRSQTLAAPQVSAERTGDAPFAALSADAASADLLRLAQALAVNAIKQPLGQEPSSSLSSDASRREVAGRSS